MATRLAALLPRLAALTLIWLLAAASLTFAAGTSRIPKKLKPAVAPPKQEKAVARTFVVPDLRRQPYVFAKGILEDAGFAWRVEGRVEGYATNVVAVQVPSPGTKIATEGTPTIILGLERNPSYAESGVPQNESPYRGEAAAGESKPAKPKRKAPSADSAAPPAAPSPAPASTKQAPKSAAARAREVAVEPATQAPAVRTPAFELPGAPPEQLDEMPLPERARMIEKRMLKSAGPSRELIKWWLYQHAWVVTGARFGWSNGAEAIRIVIRVDRELEQRFGFGAKSEAVARRALAEVERLSRA
jgi:hypothetical protein